MSDFLYQKRQRFTFRCNTPYPIRLVDGSLEELDEARVDIDAFPWDMTVHQIMQIDIADALRQFPKRPQSIST